jgi:hypothetical protein
MKVSEILEFERLPDPAVRELLERSGGRPHLSPAEWLLPSGAAPSVEAELSRRGVRFEVFYELEPAPGESPDELAAYLPLQDFDRLRKDDRPLVLAVDERTNARIASEALVRVLDEVTAGVAWTPSEEHGGMLVLSDARPLPDPVVVPHAVSLSQTSGGAWAVRTDGRELLTPASVRALRDAGIALAPFFSTGGRTLPWIRPPVFGGRVLESLRGLEVNGINGAPVYLGQAGEGG